MICFPFRRIWLGCILSGLWWSFPVQRMCHTVGSVPYVVSKHGLIDYKEQIIQGQIYQSKQADKTSMPILTYKIPSLLTSATVKIN